MAGVFVVAIVAIIVGAAYARNPMHNWAYRAGYDDALSGGTQGTLGVSVITFCDTMQQLRNAANDVRHIDSPASYEKYMNGCTAGMARLGYREQTS